MEEAQRASLSPMEFEAARAYQAFTDLTDQVARERQASLRERHAHLSDEHLCADLIVTREALQVRMKEAEMAHRDTDRLRDQLTGLKDELAERVHDKADKAKQGGAI